MSTATVITAPPGAKIVDLRNILAPAGYAALVADDVWGVLIDIATRGAALGIERARQAGLAAGVFQGYDPAAWADPAQATGRATWALNVLHGADALAPGLTVGLDFEAVPIPEM